MKIQVKVSIAVIAVTSLVIINNTNAQTISDAQLKKNAAPITNSLSYIAQLEPLSFEFDSDKFKQLDLPAGKQYGLATEDVQQILPALITQKNKWYNAGKNNPRAVSYNSVNYEMLVPLLVGAVKEQQAEIEQLKAQLQQLKSK